MASNSKEFFTLIVEPTVSEFAEHPQDLRRGLLATIILNHMVDHLAQDGQLATDRRTMDDRVRAKRKEILGDCPEFQLVWDVADATKHAKLSAKHRSVSSSDQFASSPGIFNAPFGQGVFAEAAIVFVTLENGVETPLMPALMAVFEKLKSKI